MNKLFYPALFHRAEEGGFWVSFPDFPECFTEGEDMTQAYEMAVEALGLALINRKEDGQTIPQPAEIDKISVDDGTLAIIEFDMLEYQKKAQFQGSKENVEHTSVAE